MCGCSNEEREMTEKTSVNQSINKSITDREKVMYLWAAVLREVEKQS